ncbi:MAG: hypothetical protein EXX96DRAFT_166665 [Benjaminiella poitrasii]|nr:MAG: hypothetical protein EXX96DRAFT_166665 [Benjaminiella poitrasii]
MEGIYQNSLYSSTQPQPSYVLPTTQSQSEHYSNTHHAYRSSAFSDPRTPSSYSTASHSLPSYSSPTVSTYSPYGNHHYNNPSWSAPSWNTNSSSLPPPNCHLLSYSAYNNTSHLSSTTTPMQRPKLTTTLWEDEGTICYQVDAKSICVARRQDNDMINGTKLLNVVGMSRGKRDGILKNEKGRVVVKVGAMHLKGVWITFSRAKDLATKFKIVDILYPLFVDDPSFFLSASSSAALASATGVSATSNNFISNNALPLMLSSNIKNNNNDGFSSPSFNMQSWDNKYQSLPSISTNQPQEIILRSQQNNENSIPALSSSNDIYFPYDYRTKSNNNNNNNNSNNSNNSNSNSNNTSPLYASEHTQLTFHHQSNKEEEETAKDELQADAHPYPTSPSPKGALKYSFISNGASFHTSSWTDDTSSSTVSSSPLESSPSSVEQPVEENLTILGKGKKRGYQQQQQQQRKRTKESD